MEKELICVTFTEKEFEALKLAIAFTYHEGCFKFGDIVNSIPKKTN